MSTTMTTAERADIARMLAVDLANAVGPLAQLVAARDLQRWANLTIDELAQQCVDGGASWADVGRAIDVSREAARLKYPRK